MLPLFRDTVPGYWCSLQSPYGRGNRADHEAAGGGHEHDQKRSGVAGNLGGDLADHGFHQALHGRVMVSRYVWCDGFRPPCANTQSCGAM